MREININSIHGGISTTLNQGNADSYLGACAIDTDEKVNGRISGTISPTARQKFNETSGSLWLERNDVNDYIYYYTKDGEFGFIDEDGETNIIAELTESKGNGLKYYNNYYYLAGNNNIHRYGPMNDTPVLVEDWWTSIIKKEEVFSLKPIGSLKSWIMGVGWYDGVAQSIQETSDINFRYVEFPIQNDSSDGDDFEISISLREDNGNEPSSSVIAEQVIHSSQIKKTYSSTEDITSYTSVVADLGEQTIPANTRLWIVIERVGVWRGDNKDLLRTISTINNKYTNGKRLVLFGDAWGEEVGRDLILALYKDIVTIGKLGNESYPIIDDYEIPNHSMFLHSDNSLYVTDYKGKKGSIARIITAPSIGVCGAKGIAVGDFIKGETSGSTATVLDVKKDVESVLGDLAFNGYLTLTAVFGEFEVGEEIKNISGDTATVSRELIIGESAAFLNEFALELLYGEKPIAISNYGFDLGIITQRGNQASLALWDTFSASPYRNIKLPYELASAIHTHNGDLFVFGGKDRMTIGRYIGGETIEEVFHCDHATLPLQGAVISSDGRMLIGSKQTYPKEGGCIWSFGTIATMPNALHPIESTPGKITALCDGISSSNGLYKKANKNFDSVFRSQMYNFSQPFTIKEINLSLSDNNKTEVKAILHYDNDRITDEHTIVLEENSRNFVIYPEHRGTTNFYLEILIKGEDFVSVNLPIRIAYEY